MCVYVPTYMCILKKCVVYAGFMCMSALTYIFIGHMFRLRGLKWIGVICEVVYTHHNY